MLTSPFFIQPIPILLFMGEGKDRKATPYMFPAFLSPLSPSFSMEREGLKITKRGCCRLNR